MVRRRMPKKKPHTWRPRMTQSATLSGGPAVVEHLLRTKLYRQLTEAQAVSLWDECKRALQASDLQETVDECEESCSGRLDTLPRGDVLDALARILTSTTWPLNMTSQAESAVFIEKLGQAFLARGYVRAAD